MEEAGAVCKPARKNKQLKYGGQQMTRNFKQQHMTGNFGHDVAKTRLAKKLQNNGFDVASIRKTILQHPTIREYIAKNLVRVDRIIGQNFRVSCVNTTLGEAGVAHNALNNKCTIALQVKNICTRIVRNITKSGKNYGISKGIDKVKNSHYSDVIYVGADQLTLDWVKGEYSQPMNKNLTLLEKHKKYDGWN